jgi:hypothetical protein
MVSDRWYRYGARGSLRVAAEFTEDGDSAAEWSAPDRPTACDEFIEFRELGYSVPEPVPCCKSNVPDVAHENGHSTERQGSSVVQRVWRR